jgi:hypothetical protein
MRLGSGYLEGLGARKKNYTSRKNNEFEEQYGYGVLRNGAAEGILYAGAF